MTRGPLKVTPDPPLSPGKWRPPQTWEELDPMSKFYAAVLKTATDAVDALSRKGNGLTILIMVSPNVLGCAGYGNLPCDNHPTSF